MLVPENRQVGRRIGGRNWKRHGAQKSIRRVGYSSALNPARSLPVGAKEAEKRANRPLDTFSGWTRLAFPGTHHRMHFPRFTASILLFTGLFASVALGREALSGSADALKLSLKDLHTTLSSHDLGFHLSSPKVFRLVDHTADSAEALARSAGAGESRAAVGTAMNDLRAHLEEMRGVISHMNLAENERKALRNVDVRYGDVVLCWQAYGSTGEELFLHRRAAAASAEGSVSPVASLSRPLPAPASTPAAASKPAPEPKPAKASGRRGGEWTGAQPGAQLLVEYLWNSQPRGAHR